MSELDKILEGLVQRTVDGKLKWNRTVETRQFVTSVDAISVVVRELNEAHLTTPARHRLEILDVEGSTVEVLESEDEYGLVPVDRLATSEQSYYMDRLYALARRSALDTQSTLQKLAKALETD